MTVVLVVGSLPCSSLARRMTFTPRRVSVFENTFRPGLDSATFTVHVAPAGTLSFLFPSVTFFFAARAARDASKRVFTLLLKSNVILHDSTAPSGQPTLARTWNPLRRTRTSFSLLKLAPCSSLDVSDSGSALGKKEIAVNTTF